MSDKPQHTSALQSSAELMRSLAEDFERLTAERDVLEKALREILVQTLPSNPHGKPSPIPDRGREVIAQCCQNALAALKGEDDER